jgi:chorismate lyase
VKIEHHHSRSRQPWLKKPMISNAYRKWLIDDGSLTARLKVLYADFEVNPVLLKDASAFADESAILCLKANQHALIREVMLMGNNQPVVFAHSVLPRSSLRGAWYGLGKLGNKPLGETLFANPKVKRTPLAYKELPRHHPISVRVAEHLQTRPKTLWARRSIFSLGCARILVTEVFLDELLK